MVLVRHSQLNNYLFNVAVKYQNRHLIWLKILKIVSRFFSQKKQILHHSLLYIHHCKIYTYHSQNWNFLFANIYILPHFLCQLLQHAVNIQSSFSLHSSRSCSEYKEKALFWLLLFSENLTSLWILAFWHNSAPSGPFCCSCSIYPCGLFYLEHTF